jgi:hypothetical protein
LLENSEANASPPFSEEKMMMMMISRKKTHSGTGAGATKTGVRAAAAGPVAPERLIIGGIIIA